MFRILFWQCVFLLLFVQKIHDQGWTIVSQDENTLVLSRPHQGYPDHPDFSVERIKQLWYGHAPQ